jgi:hypothetical protein
VAIQGGLALLVLVLAYTTWQRPPEKQAGEVFVLDITKNDLDNVRFEIRRARAGPSWPRARTTTGRSSPCGCPGSTAPAPPCPRAIPASPSSSPNG